MTIQFKQRAIAIEQSFENFDRRIAWSFGAVLLALLMIILLSIGFYYHSFEQREQNKLFTIVTKIVSNSLNHISFSGKYHARLLLEELVGHEPVIRYILLVDKEGSVQASSDPARNDTQLDEQALATARIVLSGKQREIREFEILGEPIREITVSYQGGLNNETTGVIQVGFSNQTYLAGWHQGLLIAGVLLLLLMLVGVLVTRRISQTFGRPVIQLANDLSATLQAIPDLMFELDLDGRYINVMSTRDSLLAAPKDTLLGNTVNDVLPPEAAATVLQALKMAAEKGHAYGFKINLPLADGISWFELSVANKAVPEGESPRFIVLSRDITERKHAEDEIFTLAFYDPLTKLPNRRLLHDRLHHAQSIRARAEYYGAVRS